MGVSDYNLGRSSGHAVTLKPGGPERDPEVVPGPTGAYSDQPHKDAVQTLRESDPLIIVRDGRAVHMANGRAAMQREQSTHRGTRLLPTRGVKLPACKGDGLWHPVPGLVPRARIPEEPGAVVPHARICGGARPVKPASLPQPHFAKLK